MSEIRNLTRNGETFYPQTHAEGVLDPEGEFFGYYEENPEWIRVIADHEGRILAGVKTDGSIEWAVGTPQPIKKYIDENFVNKEEGKSLINSDYAEGIEYIENPEWIKVILDPENRILAGIKADGSIDWSVGIPQPVKEELLKKIDKEEGKSLIDSDYAEGIKYVDNSEYINVKIDSEDKIIEAIKPDGTKILPAGIDIGSNKIESIEDLEKRYEITTDSKDRIISYRNNDGIKYENIGIDTPLVKTNNLNLTKEGMTDFQQALKESGFVPGGGGNLSDKDYIDIPNPKKYGMINFILDGDFPAWYHNSKIGEFEYYDYNGNYFRKPCTITTQGQTSIQFALNKGKGNYTLDIEDGSEVKFGDWIPQDSFHLKGCAKDVTKGYLATSYKWAYMMMEYLNAKPNRQLSKEDNINTTQSSGDFFSDWGDGARCIPDGFPVEIYLNGAYWGMYALQLKKHRKNYSMDKKDYTSCFIDPDHYMPSTGTPGGFWEGEFWWNRFEIRGPKDLICMDGSEYDGDAPKELIDETSEFYDASNKKHKGSAQTKHIIESFSTKYLEVKSLIDSSNIEQAKEKFEEYFDYNACMLVYVFNSLMRNSDSIIKNTLWGIWKNKKIAPLLWDLDGVYGEGWIGTSAAGPDAYIWNYYKAPNWPLALFGKLYFDEIKEAYYSLRRSGIISIDTWREVIYGWVNSIGVDAYQRDLKKWPETPSYRADLTNTEYWKYSSGECDEWDEQRAYSRGEKVWLNRTLPNQAVDGVVYEAIQDVPAGVCPVTEFYERFPRVGGFYDSPKRMEKWMTRQIELCDQLLNYINN